MATEKTALQELKDFLNKLFQFETQDLDFGIYKILHFKRNEIKQFIDELLVERVKEQLRTLSTKEAQNAEAELEEYKTKDTIKGWVDAKEKNDTNRIAIYESDFKKDIARYKEVERIVQAARAAVDAEKVIYNHLTLFFSRYYDKGDFISKRRFGKNEKYIVPYNGEETHFYWANHDQYYIKSTEHFQKYSFKVPYLNGTLAVHFKLTEAETEQGNVKADENRYFILSGKAPEISEDELNVYFEYRALTDDEKKESGSKNKQEKLNENAAKVLEEKFKGNKLTLQLWKTEGEDDENLMLKNIHRYTRRNNYDFFIHKNLKSFLEKELDYYIKSELVNVDDLYVLENDLHFDRIRHNFKTIKVFKNIADTIIEFLSQIEEFQKKLWEKKKFVLSTEWVITIDKLVEWLGEEGAKPFMLEALINEKQCNEWKELFGDEIGLAYDPAKINTDELKHDLYNWKKLPIDTMHFWPEFKIKLINALSEVIDLEEKLEGLVVHSDNYHGVNQLLEKFYRKIISLHIDPPYNTFSSGFLYKNNYRKSSWLTMMENKISYSLDLLNEKGSFLCHIDEYEYESLYQLFRARNFPYLGTVIWDKKNPMRGGKGLAIQHEFIIWASQHTGQFESKSENIKRILQKAKSSINKHNGINDDSRREFAEWVKEYKYLSGGERMYEYLEDDGRVYRLVAMTWPNPNKAPEQFFIPLIHPVTQKPCPVPSRGWSRTPVKMRELIDKNEIVFGVDETTQPQRKIYLESNKNKPVATVLSNGKKGKAEIEKLGLNFSYCHPTNLYEELLFASFIENKKEGYILDFFAGSGTNFHAAQTLNRIDQGNRKCILIEQDNYVYTVIIPRIKKIAYTFDWKDGLPRNGSMNGLGVFFKYQRLEQYEEALENIAFSAKENAVQKALQFKDYIPKYFLDFETRDSRTLVNTEVMADPWDYKLKVWDGYTYDTEQAVDLVETFNYLIGLHMHKCITKEIDGRKYQFVYGKTNNNRQILIVWRNVKDWDLATFEADGKLLREELKKWTYDVLYINGQAHVEGYQPIEEVFKNKMNS